MHSSLRSYSKIKVAGPLRRLACVRHGPLQPVGNRTAVPSGSGPAWSAWSADVELGRARALTGPETQATLCIARRTVVATFVGSATTLTAMIETLQTEAIIAKSAVPDCIVCCGARSARDLRIGVEHGLVEGAAAQCRRFDIRT